MCWISSAPLLTFESRADFLSYDMLNILESPPCMKPPPLIRDRLEPPVLALDMLIVFEIKPRLDFMVVPCLVGYIELEKLALEKDGRVESSSMSFSSDLSISLELSESSSWILPFSYFESLF